MKFSENVGRFMMLISAIALRWLIVQCVWAVVRGTPDRKADLVCMVVAVLWILSDMLILEVKR
jgi:hypothetical protein